MESNSQSNIKHKNHDVENDYDQGRSTSDIRKSFSDTNLTTKINGKCEISSNVKQRDEDYSSEPALVMNDQQVHNEKKRQVEVSKGDAKAEECLSHHSNFENDLGDEVKDNYDHQSDEGAVLKVVHQEMKAQGHPTASETGSAVLLHDTTSNNRVTGNEQNLPEQDINKEVNSYHGVRDQSMTEGGSKPTLYHTYHKYHKDATNSLHASEEKIQKECKVQKGYHFETGEKTFEDDSKTILLYKHAANPTSYCSNREVKTQKEHEVRIQLSRVQVDLNSYAMDQLNVKKHPKTRSQPSKSDSEDNFNDVKQSDDKFLTGSKEKWIENDYQNKSSRQSQVKKSSSEYLIKPYVSRRPSRKCYSESDSDSEPALDELDLHLNSKTQAYNDKTSRHLVKNKTKPYVIHHPSQMVRVEKGSYSELTLYNRDLHGKSTVPKYYEKPAGSHAINYFEPYSDEESDFETSENTVHYNSVEEDNSEDDCLVQPKNAKELRPNVVGSSHRNKNSKRLLKQPKNGSLNRAKNENTRKKKDNEKQFRGLMSSERPKQTTIQIRNVSLLSEEILHLYFKNERRSHGGKVSKIVFENAYDRAIIHFDNADVTERVLNKDDHSLEGQRLYVSKLTPQCKNRFYLEKIPKWIKLNLLKIYLEAISHSSIGDIQFGKDNEGAIVSFQNEVSDLQNKLNTRPLKDDNGREMNDVKVHPVVHPDAVLVCGTFPNIDHLIYPIEDFLSNYQDKVSPNIRAVFAKEESNMVLVIFEDYRAVSLLNDSLTIGDNTFSISPFFDHLGWVTLGQKTNILRECPSSRITEKLSHLQIEFLLKPVGINFVRAEVDKQQWHCVFEITEEKVLAVTSETKAIGEQVTKYILGCMMSVDIVLDDAMMACLSKKESELQHLVSDNNIRKWFCYSQNKSLLTILAASSEIEVIKQDVERFFSENVVSEVTIVESKMHCKYLRKFHGNDLKLKCLRDCNGIIPLKFNSNGVMVASGTKQQIQMLMVHVNNLLSDVQIIPCIIKTPGMASHFQSRDVFLKISRIADRSETIIDIDYDNKSAMNNVAQFNNGVKLEGLLDQKLKFVVVHGDITVQNVDCIVNVTNGNLDHIGGEAAAIVQACGWQIQKECSDFVSCNGALDVSDVFVSNAGNLLCKKVIHVCGPRWKGGTANEERKLYNAIISCIKAAESENLRSIAFPAVSTKIFGYPPEKAVSVIIDAIVKTTGDVGPLYKIMLVDTDENTTNLFSKTIANLNGFQDKNQSAIPKSSFQEFGQAISKKYVQSNRDSGKKTQKSENLIYGGQPTATDKSNSLFATAFDWAVTSNIHQYQTVIGKSFAVKERAMEQSITLCICGPSQNVQYASKLLNDTCDEECPELIVSRDIISAFDPITVDKMHQQAMMFSVEIEVIREQCKVKVKGYRAFEFRNFLIDILDTMKDELTEVNAKQYKRKNTSSSEFPSSIITKKLSHLQTEFLMKPVGFNKIQIRNVSLLSEEILHLYFKNERRSHGGKVSNIVFEKAYDRAIIHFDNADVTERVLNKDDHSLEGQRLYVSKLPPQCKNRFYLEKIPKWIKLNLLKIYLQEILQSSVDDIQFGKDNEGAIVSFQNEVSDLQNKLNTRPLKDDNGREMNDVKVHPVVHPDAVLVCGTFPNIDHLIYPIEDFLSNYQDKVSPNIRAVFAKEENYRAVSLLNDSLTIGDNTFSISPFFDHLGWVPQDRKANVHREYLSSITTKKLSHLQAEFLSIPVGINFVRAEVDKQQWHCDFEITESKVLAVTSETKAIGEQVTKYILGCMTSIDIVLNDAMVNCLSKKESELRHLVSENNIRKWFCYSQNKSLLTIVAASSEIEVIKQDVERFFSENVVSEVTIVESKMHCKYLRKFHGNDLKLKWLRDCNGIIPLKFNSNGIMVASGTKQQIQMLMVHVNNLLSDVQIIPCIIKTPGMASHFQSEPGLIEVNLIADKSETIIDIDYDNNSAINNTAQFNDVVKLERFYHPPKSFFSCSFDQAVRSNVNHYKTVVGKSSAVQEMPIEQSITLCICGPSQNVQYASKMLNELCEEIKIVSRDIIGQFDTITITKLHQQAARFNVEIEVIREQCIVKVKGFRALDFLNFLNDVLDTMKGALTEVKAKWYKRKDTCFPWDEIKGEVFRLENEYQHYGGQGCIQFESENDGLVSIDFDNMVILSASKNILYNLKRLDSSNKPPEWDWDGECLTDYKLVELQSNSLEYSNISYAVSQTANVIIEKIERVENPCKYQQYVALKRKMEQSLFGVRDCVAEKYLFHDTATGNIPGICTYGFSSTLMGQNGVAYGHGLNFARDFSYTANPQYGPRTVFYARVLTGYYTKGTADMKAAPFVDPSKNLRFDSVVDDIKNPSVYVVFSNNHAYPAYVITYKAGYNFFRFS